METLRVLMALCLLIGLAVGASVKSSSDEDEDSMTSSTTYTDQWAVHIEGGNAIADSIAARHGFTNLGPIFGDYYHFQHRKVAKRSALPGIHHDRLLNDDPEVRWVKQQVVKKRVKRDYLDMTEESSRPERSRASDRGRPSRRAGFSSARSVTYNLNDPRWAQMWYLNRGMGLDMNVQEAWAEGVTGKGTVVTILDDGLEKDHPDIRRNYDPQASYDVNSHDDDPMPRYDLIDSNRHGTRCAGEVAAEGNNSICAIGVAFDAGIGGVRMLDGDVTDAVEARSLSLNPHHIDIYSASWGPDDDGKTVDGPGELATRAFIEGVTKGRGGKGSIFVWASGNGGRDHDNCNCDGYTNSIWTLSISSATENGYVPWYSEACSSTLATTYSSGSSGEKQIVTTDLHHSCTASHTGTSASAPLAAGICALALEANRNLTWRDMQHIVVRTAKPANLKADDWQVNGVGRNVSHSFGYGLMDAAAMVRLARVWTTVAPQQFCEIRAPDTNKLIAAKSQIKIQLTVRDCPGVNFMEHLQARITLAAVSRGDIQIYLSSPSGTRSTLLALRPHDSSRNGFHSWPFMSVHYWGESPVGVWTLEIQNEGRYLGRATLQDWVLKVYGTKTDPTRPVRPSPPPTTTTTTASPVRNSRTWLNTSSTATTMGSLSASGVVGPRSGHDSVARSKSATLAEWNVVVYGTKEAPEAKNRAAVSLPPSQSIPAVTTPSLAIPAVMQPQPKMMVEQQPAEDRQWSDVGGGSDRKSSQHQNNVEQNRGASPFPPPPPPSSPQQQQPPAAVDQPVVMSSSSSSSVRCRPGHWDSAAAVCLMCVNGAYLFEGRCLTSCPDATHAANGSVLAGEPVGICLPCHYSCVTCTGASDSECISCHADAKLSGTATERYCRPKELVDQLAAYDRWALGIELALALNVAVLVALLAYLFCSSKSCTRSDRMVGAGERRRLNTGSTADYRHLISVHPDASLKSPGNNSSVYKDSTKTAVLSEDEDDEEMEQ